MSILFENLMFCMIGFMVSQFTVAVLFYENYKELEIPHE